MAKLYDMANMTVASAPGTGTIALGAPASADGVTYLSFAQAGAQTGDVVSYRIRDGANWELGRGTYTAAGLTLTRAPLWSSAGAATAINASAAASVFISVLAEDVTGGPFLSLSGGTLTGALVINANTAPPPAPPSAGTLLQLSQADGVLARLLIDGVGTSVNPNLSFRVARGTGIARTATQSGDVLGAIVFVGYGATAYSGNRGVVGLYAAENWTDAAQGTYFAIATTASGTAAQAEVGRFNQLGLTVTTNSTTAVNFMNTAGPGITAVTCGVLLSVPAAT